ncbi:uncharacterized protein LOC126909537 isoform X2 [Daktulosphaira vitifoliae]|uniref:uncharacterized protein LOC126909537 isoform X2 n=1 Tax=Daktulosphaira vitifoliae TaxID=58002 RepID=UPI0021AA6091|nr:uncharacterized protein LOC126909537 isoform X2 [Daktulosphaira vitifoliae]
MEGKKKSKSVTYEQKQLLIDFVHKHPKLNSKKFGPSFTMKDAQLLWQNITKNLNETVGPKKTWVEWRKCFQYLKSAAKQKVPSKSSFKKTGGGERDDDEYIDQADEQLLDIIGPTAVHGHDLVNESTCMVSFVTNDVDPVQTLEETSTHNLISIEANPVEICVQENSNLEFKDNNINFENCDKLNMAEKELELDPFDTYIRNNNKRHADVVKDIANYQKTYNKSNMVNFSICQITESNIKGV